ncbi:MAG: lamin tail domain-containing protein [Pirellulales bacterium]
MSHRARSFGFKSQRRRQNRKGAASRGYSTRLRLESLESRQMLDSTVVFNELMYHPLQDLDSTREYIELYNQLNVNMDVFDWKLEGGVDFQFADGTIVEARKTLLVVPFDPVAQPQTLAEFKAAYNVGATVKIVGPYTGLLSNGGEELRLVNNGGRLMNVLDYGDGGDWPVEPDGGGASLVKRDPALATEAAENWTSSPNVGGSAGTAAVVSTGQTIVINEVASASSDLFWLELTNVGPSAANLGGMVVASPAPGAGEYVLPAQTLQPGEFKVLVQMDLGFRPGSGDAIFLYNSTKTQLLDARRADDTVRGRSDRYGDRWLYPTQATPGVANAFTFQDNVVINEIMYHDAPSPAIPGTPPTYQTTTLVDIDATRMWRYNQSGDQLPVTWMESTHPVDNVKWFEGAALLAYESAGLPEPIRTTLVNPRTVTPYVVTYYFETEFQFTGDPTKVDLQLRHVIDDGAVFYLNGHKLTAFNLPDQGVDATTWATGVDNATYVGPVDVEEQYLVAGTNVLSVEVHQTNNTSSDIVFGVELTARVPSDPGTPGTPFAESDEEWIELYNRGATSVELAGWDLAGGIDFNFPAGTTLGAGQYLVVARDAVALAAKYPGIAVVGNWSGTLQNESDTILLRDAARNPADEVRYFDEGRWPGYADGGGSSLELRNPSADNTRPEAWAASDEGAKSSWKTYTVTKTSFEPLEVGTVYNEFIFGLLDNGEFLIDDVSVVRDPATAPAEMIQNGTFQADALGAAPATWRVIGSHGGKVETDPANAANKVLHITVRDPQQFVHDHVETTFVGNTAIQDGHEYRVSFRAKWLAGNSQIQNRLYFTRMGNKILLDVPANHGTPGAQNSRYQANVGPTYPAFGHTPVMPQPAQAVTVSARAEDPDGVASMALKWRVDNGALNTVAMTLAADGYYRASIPGQAAGIVVQFWVEGTDSLGAVSTYPAGGANSRALYEVYDNQAASTPVDTFRIVLLAADNTSLFTPANLMSSADVPGTLIYNNQKAYYGVSVQVVGSRFTRPNSGYKVTLGSDQKFLGEHSDIRFDISGGGALEIYRKQMVNRAGGTSVSIYDDIAYMITPQHSGRIALLQLARFEDTFLDEQFANGGQGTLFELDDITFPTVSGANPEALKTTTNYTSQDMHDRGPDPEAYRGHLLIKNNRVRDDYSGIVAMSQAINKTGQALYDATNAVMDVDLWMRHYATQSYLGNWDTYGFGRSKNLRIYQRPSDGKMIPLYWDADLANFTEPLIYNGNLSRLDEIRDIPQNKRLFYGHLLDLANRAFNDEYIGPWITHYATRAGNIFGNSLSLIASRETQVRSFIATNAPQVAFNITTNGGNPLSVAGAGTTLAGDGWINVRTIRLAGRPTPLDVTWTDFDSWQVSIPLAPGAQNYTLEAYGFKGELLASDTINITSTVAERPLQDYLRIVEIMHTPAPPTPAEITAGYDAASDFEYLELMNTSATATLDLAGVNLSDGVSFTFGAATLAPGARTVVVGNLPAFQLRHGAGATVAGEFTGKLGGSDRLLLADSFQQTILDFTYDSTASWPGKADGKGASLEMSDPAATAAADYGLSASWQSSVAYGGTPGGAPLASPGVVVNEVLTHTDYPQRDSIELYNTTDQAVDLSGWYLSDSWGWDYLAGGDYEKFQIPADTWIGPHAYRVFYEGHYAGQDPTLLVDPVTEFGGTGPKDFGLNGASGDDVWLMETGGSGNLYRFADHVDFIAAVNGESFGRWPDGSGVLYPQRERTLGDTNAGPRFSPVVISEVMYNPGLTGYEYVELHNASAASQPLFNPLHPQNTWQLDGIAYSFPQGVTLAPGETILVAPVTPAVFRAFYTVPADVRIFGPYTGALDDAGEVLRLLRPDDPTPEVPPVVPWVLVDEVHYLPSGDWPAGANGTGQSLARRNAMTWGDDPASWTAHSPSAGTVAFVELTVAGRHVFYNNSLLDGSNPAANAADDAARAADKSALLPGQAPAAANHTAYSRGINGIMIDATNLSTAPTLENYAQFFQFRVPDAQAPNGWTDAPAPADVAVRVGAGAAGSDRITLVWADGAVKNTWLEVTVKASETTGRYVPDVFYWGNLAGDATGDAKVDIFDVAVLQVNYGQTSGMTPSEGDFDLDGDVDIFDVAVLQVNYGGALAALVEPGAAPVAAMAPAPLEPLLALSPSAGVGPVADAHEVACLVDAIHAESFFERLGGPAARRSDAAASAATFESRRAARAAVFADIARDEPALLRRFTQRRIVSSRALASSLVDPGVAHSVRRGGWEGEGGTGSGGTDTFPRLT